MGSGLVAENGFAESVKTAAFSITIRSVLHLLTPDLRESERPGPVASPPVGYRLFLRSYALEKQGISTWRLYGRVKRAAVRRLFFLGRRPAVDYVDYIERKIAIPQKTESAESVPGY